MGILGSAKMDRVDDTSDDCNEAELDNSALTTGEVREVGSIVSGAAAIDVIAASAGVVTGVGGTSTVLEGRTAFESLDFFE